MLIVSLLFWFETSRKMRWGISDGKRVGEEFGWIVCRGRGGNGASLR